MLDIFRNQFGIILAENRTFFKLRRACWDAAFFCIDLPKTVFNTHNSYSSFIKFQHTLRAGKAINPRDFKGQNVAILRKRFADTLGPHVSKWWSRIDFRYFYPVYIIVGSNMGYTMYTRWAMNKYQREINQGLHIRRPRVSKDYEEDSPEDIYRDPGMIYPGEKRKEARR